MLRVFAALALLLSLLPAPARAAVTITFWSRDFDGNYFPHAFFTLRGTPDAGGAAVDGAYGFTARSISPALLFGNVAGRVETPKRAYMDHAVAHFSRQLTDAQYRAILAEVRGWSEGTGDTTYNLGKRNCVTFVREAARRAGLAAVDQPKLMKKPSRYLRTVLAANAAAVTRIETPGAAYLATLAPLDGTAPINAPLSDPGTMPARKSQAAGTSSSTSRTDS
jgi:hypothetical protein